MTLILVRLRARHFLGVGWLEHRIECYGGLRI